MTVFRLGVDRLDVDSIAADANEPFGLVITPQVVDALRTCAQEAAAVAAASAVYGRTTGVGANRDDVVDDADGAHGRRLVRSHAAGAGPDLGPDVARATMLIRAAQLARPGTGIPVEVVVALVRGLDERRTAPVRSYAGVGTGDIAVLAELALCLLGERAWSDGQVHPYVADIDASAALAFMSSSAPTAAIGALALSRLDMALRASAVVSALSAIAAFGNPQHWSSVAAATRPSVGVGRSIRVVESIATGCSWSSGRTQDPLSVRTMHFVSGPAFDCSDDARREVDDVVGSRVENPRFDSGAVWHHGGFQLTSLALRLDTLRLALTQWASTSTARTVQLNDPRTTGGRRFGADGPAGSSGVMVLEYTSAAALATVRALADPATRTSATISNGAEDHASFATRSAVATAEIVAPFCTVVACELVTALRHLRRGVADGRIELGPVARDLVRRCECLPDDTEDRPLIDDVAAALELLDGLGTTCLEAWTAEPSN